MDLLNPQAYLVLHPQQSFDTWELSLHLSCNIGMMYLHDYFFTNDEFFKVSDNI